MSAPTPEDGRAWRALRRAYGQARQCRGLAASWRWVPLPEVRA